jgi:hypothetical protein
LVIRGSPASSITKQAFRRFKVAKPSASSAVREFSVRPRITRISRIGDSRRVKRQNNWRRDGRCSTNSNRDWTKSFMSAR